jgi:hypothetical protein
MIKSFHERMAELHRKPNLTAAEKSELNMCIWKNEEWVHSMIKLQNHSFVAQMFGDTESLHTICGLIDELQNDPHMTKVGV